MSYPANPALMMWECTHDLWLHASGAPLCLVSQSKRQIQAVVCNRTCINLQLDIPCRVLLRRAQQASPESACSRTLDIQILRVYIRALAGAVERAMTSRGQRPAKPMVAAQSCTAQRSLGRAAASQELSAAAPEHAVRPDKPQRGSHHAACHERTQHCGTTYVD